MNFLRLKACVVAAMIAIALSPLALIAADMDGVMMSGGKMMMMTRGKPATPMDHAITMSDGTVVTLDGLVKLKDGSEYRMHDGEMMMMDGHLMKGGKAAPMNP